MGCFLPCFGSKKKDRKRRKKQPIPNHQSLQGNHVEVPPPPLQVNVQGGQRNECEPSIDLNKDQRNESNEPLVPINSLNKDCTENPIIPVEEPRNKLEEQLSFGARKKVTFDLNVQAHDVKPSQEVESSAREDVKEEKGTEQKELNLLLEDDSSSTSRGSYPPNHRYQNYTNSDNEYDDYSDDFSDAHDGDANRENMQEESSESLFSLPSAVQNGGSEIIMGEKEVNSPVPLQAKSTRDRSQYVHSVLNPIENLTQWKEAKMGSKQSPKQQMEKVDSEKEVEIPFSSEPSFRLPTVSPNSKTNRSGSPKEDVAVDTSLSTWLGSAERTSVSRTSNFSNGTESADRTSISRTSNFSNGTESADRFKSPRSSYSRSPRFHEDRPILGALTLDELKQFSATSSPRKSPSRSPDEIPIVGTVGSYWSHTGQTTDTSTSSPSSCKAGIPNTTSKYREDKIVHWHSTPFEKRLERALNTGEPEAYSC